MRVWLWIASLSALGLGYVMSATFGGDYYMTIDKIDNQPELSREFADWHLFVRRINKKEKILDGFYHVKKDIVGPKAILSAYILSNNKFYKMAINELVPTNLCDDMIKKNFITPYFEGNSTFCTPQDCVIHPGHMQIKTNPGRSFDALAHRVMNKTIYGTYRLVGKIIDKDSRVIGGATWTVTARKKE